MSSRHVAPEELWYWLNSLLFRFLESGIFVRVFLPLAMSVSVPLSQVQHQKVQSDLLRRGCEAHHIDLISVL